MPPSFAKSEMSSMGLVGRMDKVRIAQIFFPFTLVVLWQIAAMAMGPFFVASPAATFRALAEGARSGWLGENLRVTMTGLLYGYALAVGAGLLVGFLVGISRFAHEVFEPIIIALYAVPKVTLFPIFLFLFGLGVTSKAWFAMFFGVFPIIIFTMNGTRSVRRVYLKVARSLRLSKLQLFRSVVFPAILPSLVAGLRLGFGVTFLGVVLGEMFASRHGLGFVLVQSVSLHDMPRMYGLVLLLTLIAFVVNGAFLLWETLLTHRRPVQAVAF